MAQLLFTIPDEWAPKLAAVYAEGYQATYIDPETKEVVNNPETLQQYITKKRIQKMKQDLIEFYVPPLAREDKAAKIAEIMAIDITIVPVP